MDIYFETSAPSLRAHLHTCQRVFTSYALICVCLEPIDLVIKINLVYALYSGSFPVVKIVIADSYHNMHNWNFETKKVKLMIHAKSLKDC
jgi:hypothetical protein